MCASILIGPSPTKTSQSQANKDPKQKNPNLTHIICKPQMFKEARKDFTLQNEEYLRGLNNGGVGAYLGANTNGDKCQRMSCEYASGIYVCNDNDRAINVPFATLADYAQAVVDDPREECNWHEEHYQGGTDGEDVTWGQAFDANGWLVGWTLSCPFLHDTAGVLDADFVGHSRNVIVGFWHSDNKCP